jgi:tRNA(fMet)-specific endonuclease VapC
MTNFILDRHHATALWRGHPALVAKVAGATDAKVHLCMPTVGELWYRVFDSARTPENETTLREFLERIPILEFDATAAKEFGHIKVALHKISRPIPEVDAQIAAIARARDMTVLTADQHFSVVSGLKVENWLASVNPSKPG